MFIIIFFLNNLIAVEIDLNWVESAAAADRVSFTRQFNYIISIPEVFST